MGQVSIQLTADLLNEWLAQGSRIAYEITAHGLPLNAELVGVVHQRHTHTLLLTWEHPLLPEPGPGERPPIWTPEATTRRLAEEAP